MSQFRIGRLHGGFVVTWVRDGRRRRYRLAAQSAKEAEAEALVVIRRETAARGPLTVADIWEAYRDHLGARPTATTMKYTGKAVLAHFGALFPDQILTRHCRDYLRQRIASGRKAGAVWTELGHLRSAMTWAFQERLIERAPKIERPVKPAPKERYLDRTEIARLLAADCEPHIRLAILLMLTTAARVGAVLDLTWDRVDMDRGQINLRVDQEGPRKGRAVVPINATLRAALTSAVEAATIDHVIEWNGSPVRSIRKGFSKAIENAGLEGVSQHTLRHTAAVHMAAAGIEMSKISQYLGHSNLHITTQVYARFAPNHMTDAADVLDFGNLRKVQ